MLALAHVAPDKRGKAVQIEPVSPARPILAPADESIVAILRAAYRGKDLK